MLIVLLAIILCLIFSAPFIINVFIEKHGEALNISDFLKPNDFLSYLGAILGFISTIIFSSLAFWQNHKLNQVNAKILENEHRYSSIPQFEISSVSIDYLNAFLPKDEPNFTEKNGQWDAELTTHYPGDTDCEISLSIGLKNDGDGLAKNLKATFIDPHASYDMMDKSKDKSIWVEESALRHITKVNNIACFSYSLPLLMSQHDNDHRSITLEYTNIYDYKYMYFLYIEYTFIEPYRFKISIKLTNYDTS